MTALETRPDTTTDWLDKVRELEPLIARHRNKSEKQRYLAVPVYEAMRELGLFKIWLPQVVGGDEADIHTALEITELLAKFDGSTAWNFMIGLQGSVLLGYVPEQHAIEMMRDNPDATLGGSGQPGGIAKAVDGGYICSGRWGFASGSHHTRWLCANCSIQDNGVQRVDEDGNPQMRMMWFNSDDYVLHDTWHTTGLRATGSGDIAVKDVFVPEDRFINGQMTKSPYQDGTIFQTRVALLLGPPFSAVAIGIAREALAAFIDLAIKKKPSRSNKVLSEYDSTAQLIGRAEAKINASHAYLHNAMCERLWPAMLEGNGDSEDIAVDVFYAAAFAAQNAAEAVDILVEAAGGTGIYNSSPLERCFRDVHMVSKHAGSQAAINYTRGGNFRLGNGFSMRRG
jgi:alkylation response protein AidB-like acyl-CoA dehydrogenase